MTITCDSSGHSAPLAGDGSTHSDACDCDCGCLDICKNGLQMRLDHEVPVGTTLFVGISQTGSPVSHVNHGPVYRRAGLVVDCTPSHGAYDLTIFFLDDEELCGEGSEPELLEA